MIVLLTNYLLVTSLSRLSHNVLHGATIGSSLTPDTSLSLHMEAISSPYSHTSISAIILIVMDLHD